MPAAGREAPGRDGRMRLPALLGAASVAIASIGVVTAVDRSTRTTLAAQQDEPTGVLGTETETGGADTDRDRSDRLTEGGDGSLTERGDVAGDDGGRTGGRGLDDGDRDLDPGLLLASAAVEHQELDDQDQEHLRLVFADRIDRILDESAFFVQGVDPRDVVASESAVRDEDDDTAVIVAFPAGTDLTEQALAGATTGAVETIEHEVNLPSTVGVDDGDPLDGAVVGPELESVSAHDDLEWLVFAFDEQLEEDGVDAADFGYHTADGVFVAGDEVRSIEDRTVVVAFDDRGTDVEEATRFVVAAGAVADTSGDENVVDVQGGATARPDLVDAELTRDTTVRFTFDEPVTDVDPSAFVATAVDGRRYAGEHAALSQDGRAVVAVFPGIDDFAREITRVSVEPDAAAANDRHGPSLTAGTVDLGELAAVVGQDTAGPDLLAADIDEVTGFVTLTFDEPVDDEDLDDIDPGGFHLVTVAGHVSAADFVVDATRDVVVVGFREDAAVAAAAVAVEAGAVRDFAGTPSPAASVTR